MSSTECWVCNEALSARLARKTDGILAFAMKTVAQCVCEQGLKKAGPSDHHRYICERCSFLVSKLDLFVFEVVGCMTELRQRVAEGKSLKTLKPNIEVVLEPFGEIRDSVVDVPSEHSSVHAIIESPVVTEKTRKPFSNVDVCEENTIDQSEAESSEEISVTPDMVEIRENQPLGFDEEPTDAHGEGDTLIGILEVETETISVDQTDVVNSGLVCPSRQEIMDSSCGSSCSSSENDRSVEEQVEQPKKIEVKDEGKKRKRRKQQSRRMARKIRITCAKCSAVFTSRNGLKVHTLAQHGRRKNYPLTCQHCGSYHQRLSLLNRHLVKKHGVQLPPGMVFTCPTCSKVFFERCFYEDHLNFHSGSVPFKCGLCDYKTWGRTMLNHHTRSKHKCSAGEAKKRAGLL